MEYTCYECEKEFQDELETITIVDPDCYKHEEYICEDCFSSFYSECDGCSDYTSAGEGISCDNGDILCQRCHEDHYTYCVSCENEVERENSFYLPNGDEICRSCYDNAYASCSRCNDIQETDNMRWNRDDGMICQGCYEETQEDDNDCIRNYRYKPEPNFKRDMKTERLHRYDKLYYGIELEVESNGESDFQDTTEAINNILPDVYFKRDNSLNDGFELVTHPMTYPYIIDTKNSWKKMLKIFKKDGFLSFDKGTCGIHIHMSKYAFTTFHLFKFLKMFYLPENQEQLYIIAQRSKKSTKGCCQWGHSGTETRNISNRKYMAKYKAWDGRYTAVNLENSDTIEIRIFRGTLDEASFFKNIEFCEAMFKFTRDTKLKDVTWNKFGEYVIKNKSHYRNLHAFMERKNLLHFIASSTQGATEDDPNEDHMYVNSPERASGILEYNEVLTSLRVRQNEFATQRPSYWQDSSNRIILDR